MKRHVWCDLKHPQPPWPGLLLEWRKTDAGEWEGLVIVLARAAHMLRDFAGMSQRWAPAEKLRPAAGTSRNEGGMRHLHDFLF